MMQRSQPTDSKTGHPGRARPTPAARALHLACALAGAWLVDAAAPARADLYRWVDETGTTVYSQHPAPATAPGTAPATTIKPNAAPPPEETQRALQRLRSQAEQDFDKRDQQARDAEAAAKKATEQAARQSNCEAARKNLETLEKHGAGQLRTPDGNYRFLSKDELANQKATAQKQIEDNCK